MTQLPDLKQSLQGRDLGHLRVVAQLWGLEWDAPDARVGLQRLAPAILDRAMAQEVVERLPAEARAALADLLRSDGMLPWALFTRRYGLVREMGPGRRDRERPWVQEPSIAEMLWYRALAGRDFFDTPTGLQEFAYIPEDLLLLLPVDEDEADRVFGRPASPVERAVLLPASDRLVDHACTLLAALRMGLDEQDLEQVITAWNPSPSPNPLATATLKALLQAADLLDASGFPAPEPVRAFLEAPRGKALARLASAWLGSATFNDLRLMPGLQAEGEWSNDPLRARRAVLKFLEAIPGAGEGDERPFWSLPAFIAAVKAAQPDFQRPAGDYDSWYLRSDEGDEFLRGFEHWDAVDGALLRFMITGPLHWLGILDLAAPVEGASPAAFRFSAWAAPLLHGADPPGLPPETASLVVRSDARVNVPRLSPRAARYSLARFAAWKGENQEGYEYRLTPASLARARAAGLRIPHLLGLLRRYAVTVPPSLARALERWDERGPEARLERAVVLRLGNPDLLQALRSSRAARFLGDPLGPAAVTVKPGAWQKVMAILAEMGYLGDSEGLEDETIL